MYGKVYGRFSAGILCREIFNSIKMATTPRPKKRGRRTGTITQTQTQKPVMSEIRIRSKKDFKSLDTKEMAKLAQYFGIPHSGNTKKKEFKRKIWAEIKEQSKERGDFIVGFSSGKDFIYP